MPPLHMILFSFPSCGSFLVYIKRADCQQKYVERLLLNAENIEH